MSYMLALFIAIAGTMIIMAAAAVEAGMRGLAPSPGKAPRSVRERLGYKCQENARSRRNLTARNVTTAPHAVVQAFKSTKIKSQTAHAVMALARNRERLATCSEIGSSAWYAAITGHVGRWCSRTKAGTQHAIAVAVTSLSRMDMVWLQKNYLPLENRCANCGATITGNGILCDTCKGDS